jgi:hypothetical protein
MKKLSLVTGAFVITVGGVLFFGNPAKNFLKVGKPAYQNIQGQAFHSPKNIPHQKKTKTHKQDKIPGKISSISPEYNVKINFADIEGDYKDLLGVNKAPLLKKKTGVTIDLREGYKKIGISEVRMHDDDLDVCKIYQDDEAIFDKTGDDYGDSCFLKKDSYRLTWKAKNPRNISDIGNYEFDTVDKKVQSIIDIGAKLYLRLGESWNGPNNVAKGHEEGFAKVATNILRHYLGYFGKKHVKPEISAVEVHNEADGRFWAGDNESYYKLIKKTLESVHFAGVSTAGAGGFTPGVNHGLTTKYELLYDFIDKVGLSNLDFFSAHYYGGCTKANFAGFVSWITDLKTNLSLKGFINKPIHVTEWNIGAGGACHNEVKKGKAPIIAFSQPHMFTYATGVMILMQEVENLTHAHFYEGNGTDMALFVSRPRGREIVLGKAFLSFYLHNQLKGSKLITTHIDGGMSDYSYKGNFIAKGFKKRGIHIIVLVNDGPETVKVNLNLIGPRMRTIPAKVFEYYPEAESEISVSCLSGTCELDMDEVDDYIEKSREINTLRVLYSSSSAEVNLKLEPYSVKVISL